MRRKAYVRASCGHGARCISRVRVATSFGPARPGPLPATGGPRSAGLCCCCSARSRRGPLSLLWFGVVAGRHCVGDITYA